MYSLSDSERLLIETSLEYDFDNGHDARLFTDYWFGGWVFDHNIDPPWQIACHHAKQTQIVLIGGTGSGKTVFAGMSAFCWAATTHHFKFLDVAPTQFQARQMYDAVVTRIEGTRAARIVTKTIEKPYPKITVAHDGIGVSTLEFMSTDKNANTILSGEGDFVNYDEAGLDEELDQTMIRLSTRLRGSIHDRPRLGRMQLTTNPHINPWLYFLFDMADDDPDNCLSVLVKSRQNKNITPAQLRQMTSHIPEDERDQWLEGARPEGQGKEFPQNLIDMCQDPGLNEIMRVGLGGVPEVG